MAQSSLAAWLSETTFRNRQAAQQQPMIRIFKHFNAKNVFILLDLLECVGKVERNQSRVKRFGQRLAVLHPAELSDRRCSSSQ